VAVPITIRCECGVETPATLGQRVTCSCGREYATGDIDPARTGDVAALQHRIRFYARVGMLLIVGAAILGYVIQGLAGLALAAPAAAVLWFRFVQPRFKRRLEEQLREAPAWQLSARQAPSDTAP
jgi:hypothetical protein